jgi:hypothetical protein
MKSLLLCLLLTLSSAYAADKSINYDSSNNSKVDTEFKKFFDEVFMAGKYKKFLEQLTILETNLASQNNISKHTKGYIFYWKGIAAARAQEFDLAIANFKWAIDMDFVPEDLNYELGQAYYASEKLSEARTAFRDSLKRNFKRGVSLYYVAYLSQQLQDYKKAVNLYKAVEKLPAEEYKDVLQPSKMQIADIYLEQAEKHPDAFRTVEEYVIPQYEAAIAVNPESKQAEDIKKKIIELQKKYELVLFNLRNGNPTVNPPYFLRLAQELGHDTNVIFSPNNTTNTASDKESYYSKTEFMAKYTYYLKNYIGIAPEVRMNKSYYFNRNENVSKTDSQMINPAIRSSYEHHVNGKAATLLFDYDYNYTERDVYQEEEMDFATRTQTFMIGERFKYFDAGNTTFRLKKSQMNSYDPTQNAKTTSFVLEQMASGSSGKFFMFMTSYDQRRVDNDLFDTNSLMMRGDLIFAKMESLGITPSIAMAMTFNDPINDRDARGMERMYNPSLRLSKSLKKRFKINFSANYFKNESKNEEVFAYKKRTFAFELEYLF